MKDLAGFFLFSYFFGNVINPKFLDDDETDCMATVQCGRRQQFRVNIELMIIFYLSLAKDIFLVFSIAYFGDYFV